jgi:hypothetical protein
MVEFRWAREGFYSLGGQVLGRPKKLKHGEQNSKMTLQYRETEKGPEADWITVPIVDVDW